MTPILTTFGYGWLMHTNMLILGVQWMPLRMKLTGASPMDFGSVVSPEPHVGGQNPDCLEQDEADRSPPT